MLHDSTLYSRKPKLNSSVKPANQTLGSNFTVLIATAAICVLNSQQSVFATDLNTQVEANRPIPTDFDFSKVTSHDSHEHNHNSPGLLPRIFSLITSAFKTEPDTSVVEDHHHHQPVNTLHTDTDAVGGNFTQDLVPMYLSQANLTTAKDSATKFQPISSVEGWMSTPKIELYTVQAGDTVDTIAQKYQVSRSEIVKLNNLKNSDIIFASQQLEVPATYQFSTSGQEKISFTSGNFPGSSISKESQFASSNYLASAKLNSKVLSKSNPKVNSSTSDNDPIAKLRADIDQMRTQYRQASVSDPSENILASATTKDAELSKNEVASVIAESEDFSSLSSQVISLQLPPLPPSEEFLPTTFDGYVWPAKGVLTSGYGWRWGRLHKGIDIAAPVGTPIYAAASGKVISAGWNNGGYGNLVKLRHLDGSVTLYAHNNRIMVRKGQKVTQGQKIAEMGNTGFSTGPHLHFEIHSKKFGVTNPLALLK